MALSRLPEDEETVAQFVERWLRDFPRPKASTNSHNRRMVRPIVKAFGDRKLSEVNRRAARVWALEHRANVPVARAVWNDAIDDEATVGNPFAGLRLPRSKGRSGISVVSEGEIQELAGAAEALFKGFGWTVAATIYFAAYVGCRPGEMFALDWSDLDFEKREVRIRHTLTTRGELTVPKNGLERTVVLPDQAAKAVRDMVRPPSTFEHEVERDVLFGTFPANLDGPVFLTKRKQRFRRPSHARYWDQVRKRCGKGDMEFYTLRHFCATHLLELGLSPADVAVQLGHTDGGALVMSTYGHPDHEKARERVRQAMRGGSDV